MPTPETPESSPEVLLRLPIPGVTPETDHQALGNLRILRNVPLNNAVVGQRVQVQNEEGITTEYVVIEVRHTFMNSVGTNNTASLREFRYPVPEWMRLGARLSSRGDPNSVFVVVGMVNNQVHIRKIERDVPIVFGGTVTAFTPAQVEQLFQPEGVPIPRWFTEGARIIQVSDGAEYIIGEIDALAAWFTATRPDEPRRTNRFNLSDVERHWRPYTTLSDSVVDQIVRRPTAAHLQTFSPIPPPPPWLVGGNLIRPKARDRRRTFWVASLHSDRGMCRIQQVETIDPLKMSANWEEVAYEVAASEWEPLTREGFSITETKCPHCGDCGGRFKEAEAKSAYSIRAYHCAKDHVWTFIEGGADDGRPIPPTRFERDFDF